MNFVQPTLPLAAARGKDGAPRMVEASPLFPPAGTLDAEPRTLNKPFILIPDR
jgi:hypothetical protein